MDAGMAERLASSMDPKALRSLQNRNHDPAAARAVAAQFGSFLMQGMMRDAGGDAMSVANGTGGAAVSAMFATAMSRYAMSGDKLGLADTIYRSMAAKGDPAPAAPAADPAGASPSASDTTGLPQGSGFPLAPYWRDRGRRPIGPSADHVTPAGLRAPGTISPKAAVAAKPEPATPAPARRWTGLSLPWQAHVVLPPADPAPAAPVGAVSAVSANPVAPPATVPAGNGGDGRVPDALPSPRRDGHDETAAPDPHRAAFTGGGGARTDAESFAEELAPAIDRASARLGVSPRILLAQAALETGWGHSVVGNNVFGVKAGASWSGTTVTAATHEMTGGHLVAHAGTFRAYANVGEAVDDYAALVSASGRYRAVMGAGDDVAAYARALAAGGYASDRDYAAKLAAVANSPKMSYAIASLEEAPPGQLVSAHG